MCYEDGWWGPETEEDRVERKKREAQYRLELRKKQLACQHARRYVFGQGSELSLDARLYEYVQTYCPDCDLEQEFAKSEWEAIPCKS